MGEQQRKRYMVSTVFTHVLKLGWEAARHQGKKAQGSTISLHHRKSIQGQLLAQVQMSLTRPGCC